MGISMEPFSSTCSMPYFQVRRVRPVHHELVRGDTCCADISLLSRALWNENCISPLQINTSRCWSYLTVPRIHCANICLLGSCHLPKRRSVCIHCLLNYPKSGRFQGAYAEAMQNPDPSSGFCAFTNPWALSPHVNNHEISRWTRSVKTVRL